ncbi:transcription factor homeobox like [Lecanosticta acicola]|uniref:Transcription factor homeobox like n=1 Tax=Lecanosticta acicola TaxID=111012 RepID=A0AAI8Z184_9PEZI|nr:transcription factor homeobox like [Lecanosticta acicola]
MEQEQEPPESTHRSDGYAFLNHSASTVHQNQPPMVDDKPLARQKRKRTSQEDQTVLEAAYQKDPKPDKAARLELVKQVALGEKEVQIWFQNRRQSSRRKSRPLLPHEVAQYQMSRVGMPAGSSSSRHGSPATDQDHESHVDGASSKVPGPTNASSHSSEPNPMKPDPSVSRADAATEPTATVHPTCNTSDAVGASPANSRLSLSSLTGTSTPDQQLEARTIGYLANRRSAPPVRDDLTSQNPSTVTPNVSSDRKLKKSASLVRLSMNAEGKAEIVTKDASSPSPPRPQHNVLLHDTSAVSTAVPTSAQPYGQGLHRSTSGRSRDSRAWEFWCDKEARSSLETAAERDASGSATGAIGLLRTASGRNVLGLVPSKRNSAAVQRVHPSKRSKLDQTRAALQRSSTSQGRLQGKAGQTVPKLKHSGSANLIRSHGNDSDKENWSPSTDGASDFLSRDSNPTAQRNRQAGDERVSRRTLAQTANARSRAHRPAGADIEDDAELSAFMRGGKENVSAGDDMDCVQGLLSLSQGNWR